MIKEAKDIDFYTTGREPSAQDFARISEFIEKEKQKLREQARGKLDQKILSGIGVAES